jgi:hypothetical protein
MLNSQYENGSFISKYQTQIRRCFQYLQNIELQLRNRFNISNAESGFKVI